MPRYSLKRSPWTRITSPGLSSVPASIEPSMTVSAPAASAFAMSPDEVMPPSAIDGHAVPDRATRAHSKTAVICGTPTPATTRVVQIEPGPIPTLIASAPASISASAASAVAMLPAITCTSHSALIRRTISTTDAECPCAVSTTSDVDLGVDQRAGALERVRADADRGADAQPALLVLGRERELDPLLDVLDRDQALEVAVRVDDRQLLDLVAVQDLVRLVEGRPDGCGDEVARGHQRRDGLTRVRLEAEVAVGQDPDEHAGVVGDRHAGDAVARHQLERVGDASRRAGA